MYSHKMASNNCVVSVVRKLPGEVLYERTSRAKIFRESFGKLEKSLNYRFSRAYFCVREWLCDWKNIKKFSG